MSSKPSATDPRPHPADLATEQIQRLVPDRLAGRNIDGVGFIDELLAIVQQVGEVHCSPAGDHGLRFELPGREPFEVDLDANGGKLRMLCARLAVLCHESGHDFMLYGGEGTICKTCKDDLAEKAMKSNPNSKTWKARWTNKPGNYEFTIEAGVR